MAVDLWTDYTRIACPATLPHVDTAATLPVNPAQHPSLAFEPICHYVVETTKFFLVAELVKKSIGTSIILYASLQIFG
jgi:hypothetical protein